MKKMIESTRDAEVLYCPRGFISNMEGDNND